MSDLAQLRKKKQQILDKILNLGDMRRGSVVEQYVHSTLKDGTPVRRGPYFLYSYKDRGQTVSRRLLEMADVLRYQQQIEEFRKFEELSAELVELSHEICETKLCADEQASSPKKKRRRRSSKRSTGRLDD
jgi:hypothetical protein